MVTSRAASASCRLIRRALIAGVNSAGVHATDLQVMPAAVNRHFLKTEGFDAGIHVQPSPNDPEVVQIRIFEPPGTPATPALVKEIDKHFSRQEFRRASWNEVGEISYSARTAETYVQDLSPRSTRAIRKRGFRIVVDYAFGGSLVLPQVLGALDVEAVPRTPTSASAGRRARRPRWPSRSGRRSASSRPSAPIWARCSTRARSASS